VPAEVDTVIRTEAIHKPSSAWLTQKPEVLHAADLRLPLEAGLPLVFNLFKDLASGWEVEEARSC